MSKSIAELTPKAVWENFYKLTEMPRPSNHEEAARKSIMDWAQKNNIQAEMDEVGNILLRKPATPGMENRKGVILQGHLDMVPQKNEDKKHNFVTDPIDAYVDGEWVTADGTTLGADNGIGVAAGMAVLLATDIPHGPVEVLITATEETGMDGANGIRPAWVKGDILLNLDSETEGELYVGCAGGIDGKMVFNYTEEAVPAGSKAYKLAVKGLKGGHSGMDINLGRGNANKLLARYLRAVMEELHLQVASVEGGNMRNAIPREAFAVVTVPSAVVDKFQNDVAGFLVTITAELAGVESGISFTAAPVEMPTIVMDKKSQDKFLNLIYAMPNGAIRMVADQPEIVETSTNLAIVRSNGSQIEIICLLRSSVDSAKEDLADAVIATCELAGAATKLSGSYPGWNPNFDSAILKTMKDVYQKLYNKPAVVKVIHAGLECGIFGKNYPDMDYISFGPTIEHPHSPGEKVNIPSVAHFWDYLVETLKTV